MLAARLKVRFDVRHERLVAGDELGLKESKPDCSVGLRPVQGGGGPRYLFHLCQLRPVLPCQPGRARHDRYENQDQQREPEDDPPPDGGEEEGRGPTRPPSRWRLSIHQCCLALKRIVHRAPPAGGQEWACGFASLGCRFLRAVTGCGRAISVTLAGHETGWSERA